MALVSDARFAASGEYIEPLVGAAVAVVGTAFPVARRENHLGRLGGAVAGDYAESPAEPQVLLDQLLITYCLLPVPLPMPEPGVVDGVVVVLLPMPELLPDPVEGLVVLLPLEPEPLVLLPEAPEPALEPLRASVMHLSRSAPVRPTHLLASAPDAPEAAPVPDVLPEVLVSLEVELPDADGVDEDELPLADGVDEDELPLADGVEDELPVDGLDAPVLPELEPEDWLNAAPDSARSAAAVAAVRVFNIMSEISFEGGG